MLLREMFSPIGAPNETGDDIDWLGDLKFFIDNNDRLLNHHFFPAIKKHKKHAGHPEVEGTMGQYEKCTEHGNIYLVETPDDVKKLIVNNPNNLAYVTQTTLSMTDTRVMVDALKKYFPAIQEQKKDDICYATQNRQDAVHGLAKISDLILVVGSPNSSNSNRLREIAEQLGKPAYLIDTYQDMQQEWFDGIEVVGVTAGASAPEVLVQEVIDQLKNWGGVSVVENKGIEEKVVFSLPGELKKHLAQKAI